MRYVSTPLYPRQYLTTKGRFNLTPELIRQYVDNTNRMMAAGVDVPLFGKHEPKGPEDNGKKKGIDAVGGVGWLHGAKVSGDGGLQLILDVLDPEYIRAINEGRITKTSPELSDTIYVDGNERVWGPVLRHVAFTQKPVNNDQKPIAIAMSEEHETGIRFAEPEEGVRKMKKKADGASEKKDDELGLDDEQSSSKPDTDTKDGKSKKEKEIDVESEIADVQNVNELLTAMSIPAPTVDPLEDINGWLQQLTGGLQGFITKMVSDPKNKVTNDQIGVKNQQGLAYQFAEHEDPNVRKLAQDYSALVARQHAEKREATTKAIRDRLNNMVICDPVRKSLTEKVSGICFSEDDSEEPTVTITEAIDMIEQSIPEKSRLTPKEFSPQENPEAGFLEQPVPEGEASPFYLDPAAAQKVVDQELQFQFTGK